MKYYMIGIKGAGMSALALILNDLGYEVVGYDDDKETQFTEEKLRERGIKIYTESNDELDENSIVIYSPAIKIVYELKGNREYEKALNLGVKMYEYQDMLGKLANMFELITIGGCHGKTTTTSLLAHVLNNTIGCNYLIGDGRGSASKENKKFVIEACEYHRHFLVYEPDYAVITNIDFDHVDYFKDIQDVISAYEEYANNALKMVIACGDDPYTRVMEVNKPIFFYGIDDDNDIIAKNVEYSKDGVSFEVFVEGNFYGKFDLPFYGKHMVLNSLAVIAICYYERMEAKDVLQELKTFAGSNRRFHETIVGDTVVIDDYAHHPQEVKVTIKAARQKYPDKKIVTVFQPHTFSRTQEFKDDLIVALNTSDKQFMLDVFPAREKQEDYPNIKTELLLGELNDGELIDDSSWEKLKAYKGCVVMFMSPKEIHNIMTNFIEYLND